jgi:hypothetical protein
MDKSNPYSSETEYFMLYSVIECVRNISLSNSWTFFQARVQISFAEKKADHLGKAIRREVYLHSIIWQAFIATRNSTCALSFPSIGTTSLNPSHHILPFLTRMVCLSITRITSPTRAFVYHSWDDTVTVIRWTIELLYNAFRDMPNIVTPN